MKVENKVMSYENASELHNEDKNIIRNVLGPPHTLVSVRLIKHRLRINRRRLQQYNRWKPFRKSYQQWRRWRLMKWNKALSRRFFSNSQFRSDHFSMQFVTWKTRLNLKSILVTKQWLRKNGGWVNLNHFYRFWLSRICRITMLSQDFGVTGLRVSKEKHRKRCILSNGRYPMEINRCETSILSNLSVFDDRQLLQKNNFDVNKLIKSAVRWDRDRLIKRIKYAPRLQRSAIG